MQPHNKVIVRQLGRQEYLPCWRAMQKFTDSRTEETPDEIWVLEHPPVFTQGQSGKPEHILNPGDIPVIQIDRGGQVTYHGPGQIVVYTLVDIKRKNFSIRQFVSRLEQTVIDLLAEYNIQAESNCKAPGVYVNDKKICSIGLRIRRGFAFHGIAFNAAMNLAPFNNINPCGYAGLKMTQLSELKPEVDTENTKSKLIACLINNLGYAEII